MLRVESATQDAEGRTAAAGSEFLGPGKYVKAMGKRSFVIRNIAY
jgi:hypothetical protein